LITEVGREGGQTNKRNNKPINQQTKGNSTIMVPESCVD
jgi:hypothetical protein